MRVAVPDKALPVRTYNELDRWIRGFLDGHHPFLWVVGRPGTCKSERVRAVREEIVLIEAGAIRPVQFHIAVYQSDGKRICLDDAEKLAVEKDGEKQISALGEHREQKTMTWLSSTPLLDKAGVPKVYTTSSRLCVIANRWTAHEAIQSRARLIHFRPTFSELHNEIGKWYKDKNVYKWIEAHSQYLDSDRLDARAYTHASQDKAAGMEWERNLLDVYAPDEQVVFVQELELDEKLTKPGRVKAFRDKTGMSQSTYYRIVARLKEDGQL